MMAPLMLKAPVRLRLDIRGLALVEFALGLPVLLILILYGIETANYGMSILRIHQIAATAADNAARVRDSIDEADVNEVLEGGKIIGESMDFRIRGRIVLSDVLPNGMAASGSTLPQKILWQRCSGALNVPESQPKYGLQGKGTSDRSLSFMGAGPRTIAPIAGSAMVFAEVTYRYKPVVTDSFLGTPLIRSEATFSVRERAGETLGTAPGSTPSVCTRYDL